MIHESIVNGTGMLKAINEHNYDILDEIMAPDFIDHHPGFPNITSLNEYKKALKYMHVALDMKASIDMIFSKDDRLVTSVTLKGRHIGNFMGLIPTGKEVIWTTIETYRIEGNKIKERWALDDMTGLLTQLGVTLPGT